MVHSTFCASVNLQVVASCSISSRKIDSNAGVPSNLGAEWCVRPGIVGVVAIIAGLVLVRLGFHTTGTNVGRVLVSSSESVESDCVLSGG